ncbi:hypothetical protein, partial [Blautia fusiformis]|uniref:hypothetical protein n=1 Tax=Blautia fusiformis TaxID=2881264 RepID=UPI003D9A08DB
HCFVIEKRKSLCHSLGRPSRSDFVQLGFIKKKTENSRKKNLRNSPFYYLTEQTMKLLFNIELCNKWGIRYPTAFSLP